MMVSLAFNVLKEVQIREKLPQEFYLPNITKMILKAEDDSFTGSQHFSKEQFLAILQSIFNPNLPPEDEIKVEGYLPNFIRILFLCS